MRFLPAPVSPMYRWIAFNSVGAIGFLLQITAMFLLVGVLEIHYLIATAVAVEVAVLNNFIWHENWTWVDRATTCRSDWLKRFAYFHMANGLISIAGNLLIMRILVGSLHVNYALANLVAIAICAVLNFLAGDRLVFRSCEKPS